MSFHSRSLPLLALAALLLGGCASMPDTPRVAYTGDPVVDGKAELAVAAPKDHVLWNYRVAGAALRRDQFGEAKEQLEDAMPRIGGIISHSTDAKKARSLWSGEDSKTFIGESYERVMAYYYRGILYWMDGQPDNARACFRTGQFIDSDAEQDSFKGDYVLLDYLDGFITARLAGDGSDALKRAEKTAKHPLPAYDGAANLIVFAEFGQGPRKYASGEYGEQLRFIVNESRSYSARLTVGGETLDLPAYDDLNFQATTRGGRVMDYILGRKAVFKRTTDAVGDVALVGAAVAATQIRRYDGGTSRNAETATIALAAVGLLSKVASAATTPKADTRCWENLPQRLSFGSLHLAPGEYEATLEFLDRSGQILAPRTKHLKINVKPEGDTVLFLSELSR